MNIDKAIKSHEKHYGKLPDGVICRHAERPHLDRSTKYQGLTPKGINQAFEIGQNIGGKWSIYSSPVERCRQTAMALSWGINFSGGTSSYLSELGWMGGDLLYKNHDKAMEVVFSQNLWDYIPKWKLGELEPFSEFSFFAQETCRNVSRIIQDYGNCIFVTHDINLVVLADQAGQVIDQKMYFQFMDAVTLISRPGSIGIVAWHAGVPTENWFNL